MLDGSRALATGGSSGIGRALATVASGRGSGIDMLVDCAGAMHFFDVGSGLGRLDKAPSR